MAISDLWTDIASVDDIDFSVPLCVYVQDQAIALYRVGDEVFATDDTCSHAEASLSEGSYTGYTVTCPRHGGQFDIRDGRAVKMPAVSPIETFPVRVKNGRVLIQLEDLD